MVTPFSYQNNSIKEIPIEKWREYVRQTHAFRSGTRIRRFFEPIDGGVADAAARVSVGHWLDFEALQDHDSYPINFSVMREEVNLRALAVYLRLIDLLDLAEDRTPYVIWKFVAPRNYHSKMEWNKHRALRAVTCPSYQEGRVIRVDGSTDNHEVYAALEDLRIWCETQFRGCIDTLARMNDSRHRLDIYHIDWHVEARGFKKISIGFQFDRERMFEILGEEIYQGDPYVFLRELLQNSIDAIRMRREILRKYAKIEPSDLGVIHVKVEHLDNNDAIITWNDDGIGMDEYIIQNYLAVAGKSFYRSSDFEKIGLEMDPISRFGIGIMSCFIVADSIEIETYKDPNLPPKSDPLKITIPDQIKQFRVEVLPEGFAPIGTTIRVYVNGRKVFGEEDGNTKSLDVTGYLSIIAGFVEFPIIIDEYDNKTIVLHPKRNAESIKQNCDKNYKIHQLNLSYPWSNAILPQDLSIAQELLLEQRFDLTSDLGIEDIEGVLAYLAPSDDRIDFLEYGKIVTKDKSKKYKNEMVRCGKDWRYYSDEPQGMSRSSRFKLQYSVYRDGILIPNAVLPYKLTRSTDGLPVARIVANLSRKRAPTVDLSRTGFSERFGNWYEPIYKSYAQKIRDLHLDRLLALDPFERLFQMGRIIAFCPIWASDLWKIFPHDFWPIAFLQSDGKIEVEEYKNISKNQLFSFPDPLNEDELYNLLRHNYSNSDTYNGPLTKWRGDRVVVEGKAYTFGLSMGLKGAIEISKTPVEKYYHEASVRFVRPPWEGDPPLVQGISLHKETSSNQISSEILYEKAFDNPASLDSYELFLLNKFLLHESYSSRSKSKFINFSKPFNELFAYGSKIINIEHPAGQELLKLFCAPKIFKLNANLSSNLLGKLEDTIMNYLSIGSYLRSDTLKIDYLIRDGDIIVNALNQICQAAKEAKLYNVRELEEVMPGLEDFVPGTIIDSDEVYHKIEDFDKGKIKEFGEPI